jgi:hypothetical protein
MFHHVMCISWEVSFATALTAFGVIVGSVGICISVVVV